MASTPDPVHLTIPSLIHETPVDQERSVLHQDNITRFRHHMDLFEAEYARPMALLLRESYSTNPVATVFLVVLALLIAVPVTVFTSASFFSIILVLLGVVSTGIILIVAIQSALLISLSLSVLSSAALSAAIAALFYATSWTVAAVTPPLQYSRDISLGAGAEGVALAQSLATSVSEHVPDWRDAVVDQTSMLHEQVSKIPFREWGSRLLQMWLSVPWGRMYTIILTSINTATTIIHTGFSIAQLVTVTIGLSLKVVHVMIFCVRMLVAVFQQALAAMQTLPTQDVNTPLEVVQEDIRDGGKVGVSTGVSPEASITQPSARGKGKAAVHKNQADTDAGFFFVDTTEVKVE